MNQDIKSSKSILRVIFLVVGMCISASLLWISGYELYHSEELTRSVAISEIYKSQGFISAEEWEVNYKRNSYIKLAIGMGLLLSVTIAIKKWR